MKTSQTLACNPTVAALLEYDTWNLKNIFIILMWIVPESESLRREIKPHVYDIVYTTLI